jgi:Rrf2 family protein
MSGPLNTQFAVAVHVLTLLAYDPDAAQSSEEIAGSVGASPVHVRRVLGPLRRAGLIASRTGPGGGSRLASAPEQVTLGDVWRATHGQEPVVAVHTTGSPTCPVARGVQASLCDARRRATAALVAELDRTTLAEVLGGVDAGDAGLATAR